MQSPITATLASRGISRGLPHLDAQMIALATLVGWNEHRDAPSGEVLLQKLGAGLPREDHGSGVTGARDWLLEAGLAKREWDWVDDNLRFLKSAAIGPIDWNAEAAYCLAGDMRTGPMAMSLSAARAIARILDLPLQGSIACLFSASATLAWVLAEDREVSIYADQSTAVMLALLSRAACRPLKTRRENPVDGTFMPAPYVQTDRQPPFDRYDFLVSIPPFGARLKDGPEKGVTFETYQTQLFARRATKAFYTLVPDGVLFREFEAGRRAEALSHNAATVMSLPPGILWPHSSISTSLVRLTQGPASSARLIDGRNMHKEAPGRPSEGVIAQHLDAFRGFRVDDHARIADVTIEELAANGYSLLPDRYLTSANLAAVQAALEQRPAVTLGDIADIERGKAPLPLREPDEDPALTAMEIAPADLLDGIVRPPSRQLAFDVSEEKRVRGVTVKTGDILASIKGNIGIFAIVDDMGADLAGIMSDPWIVSQSLAIIRLKPNPHIQSPAVLAALLTAPWVREKLESMSGASTVRTLTLSDLRSFNLPVPSAEDCAFAETRLADIAEVREQIKDHQSNLAERRRQLWAHLWQIPEDFEAE